MMTMTAVDFGAWLSRMRESRGWTQRDCAIALGVPDGQISRWKAFGSKEKRLALACAAIEEGGAPTRPVS